MTLDKRFPRSAELSAHHVPVSVEKGLPSPFVPPCSTQISSEFHKDSVDPTIARVLKAPDVPVSASGTAHDQHLKH